MPLEQSPVESRGRPPAASITMRVAQSEDVAALQATAIASWWATYRDLLPAKYIEDFLASAYRPSVLLTDIANPRARFLLALHDDAVIGFGQAGPALPRRDAAPVAPADLYRLYLLPTWQRQGIGTRLLGELEAWLRQQAYPYYGVYVLATNEPAKHFYLRHGFVHKPVCDIQDEWYLVKPLDG